MITKRELADKFIQAGNGDVAIEIEDLACLGITEKPKMFTSKKGRKMRLDIDNPCQRWEHFCQWVYETFSGEPFAPSMYHGRGWRSRDVAERVAKMLREE